MKGLQRMGLPEILHTLAARDLPDPSPDGVPCCMSYAVYGPSHCTCWENVHDVDQQEPRRDLQPITRDRMCSDCAFRPGSPERSNLDNAACDAEDLDAIVADPTQSFWCHDGMRSTIAQQHPNGMRVELPPVDGVVAYDPPKINGVPYRADGTPGYRCAGLAAARRATERRGA